MLILIFATCNCSDQQTTDYREKIIARVNDRNIIFKEIEISKQITDSFSFYQTPEGFIIPKSMIENREIVVEVVEGEEAEELEKFAENQKKIKEQEIKEKKERRTEINRKIADKRKKKKDYENRQLNLFDNL